MIPTNLETNEELRRWRQTFSGTAYYYGDEPGPVARRAVRYDNGPAWGRTALDAGCGEGQDVAFLAERGYITTGLEFTPEGAAKTKRLVQQRGLQAAVLPGDLRLLDSSTVYDLVLAVNVLQFLGEDASPCLARLMESTARGGTIGLSMFASESDHPEVKGTIHFTTLDHLLSLFHAWQPLEAASLWQWNASTGRPQAFVTLIARKA